MSTGNVVRTSHFQAHGRRTNARRAMDRLPEGQAQIFLTIQRNAEYDRRVDPLTDPEGAYFASLLARLDGVA